MTDDAAIARLARKPSARSLLALGAGAAVLGLAAALVHWGVFAIALAVVAIAGVVARPRQGALAVALAVPLNNLVVMKVPGMFDLRPAQVLWVALVVGLLVRRVAGRPFPIGRPPRWLAYGIGTLLGWHFLSALVNGQGLRSLVKVAQLGLFGLAVWLVAAMFAVTPSEERERAIRLAGAIGVTLMAASIAYFGLGLDWPYTITASPGAIAFLPPAGKVQEAATGVTLFRMSAFNLSVVTTASLMTGLLGVSLAAAFSAERREDRRLAWAFFTLAAVILLLTFSRAGWLVGILLVLLVAWRAGPRRLLATAAVVALLGTALLAVPEVSGRLAEFANPSEQSTTTHLDLWRTAIGFANESPLVGGGPYSFIERTRVTFDEPAHNFVLEAAADTGWTGAAVVSALVMAMLVWGWRRLRAGPPVAFAVWAGLLGAVLMNLTMNGFREDMWWMWAGIMIAVAGGCAVPPARTSAV